jgi:dTDP-4-dehydrorhamnose reductase
MRVLITGAGGLVGRALTKRFRQSADVFPMLRQDLDITDARQVHEVSDSIKPDLILNCAVIGVDDCESDPGRAHDINVAGPGFLAGAATRLGGAIVHFSTNYVFSGDRIDKGFYGTDEPGEPVNVYGETKLAGERRVLSECSRSFIVRTSWVFGEGKDSFLATAPRKLRDGQRVVAIDDTFASATWVEDLVTRVAALVESDDYGVFHVVNDGVCSYAEYAEEAAEILGVPDADRRSLIERKKESEMHRPARRPRWTPMRCDHSARLGLRAMRPWQEALRAYITASMPDRTHSVDPK